MNVMVEDLQVTLPSGFIFEEVHFAYFAEPATNPAAVPIKPNLAIHRRKVPKSSTLQPYVDGMLTGIQQALPQMTDLDKRELVFEDKVVGRIVSFSFQPAPTVQLRQMHAMRLDGELLTTLSLTVQAPAAADLEKTDAKWRKALSRSKDKST